MLYYSYLYNVYSFFYFKNILSYYYIRQKIDFTFLIFFINIFTEHFHYYYCFNRK